MKLSKRFKSLTFWNKLGVIGSVCSVVSFVGWLLWPQEVKKSPVGVVQSIQASSGGFQIGGSHNTISFFFKNDKNSEITVHSGLVPPVAEGTDSNLPALSPLPSDQATEGCGWELSLDGIDDYCWTECPQFATLRMFRLETCFYQKRESYGNHVMTIVSLTDTNSNLILALTLTPYQKNPGFSRLYFTYRDASNDLQTCEGPVIRREEWTDCFVDAGDNIIRVGAGDQVLAYPESAPICRKVRCTIGALLQRDGFYGEFSGRIRYLKIMDTKERKAYASWDFRAPSAPNRLDRQVFLDTSDFGSDLQIIGAAHLSPAVIEEWKKNGWYE